MLARQLQATMLKVYALSNFAAMLRLVAMSDAPRTKLLDLPMRSSSIASTTPQKSRLQHPKCTTTTFVSK